MKIVLLRLDAPLISFGAPAVDQNRVVQPFPALSMLTGLFANALGWDHRDQDLLTALQDRLRYAARIDRRGAELVDYQSTDLGQDWMLPEKAGWTTAGRLAERTGGSSRETHLRWRHYRADSVHTLAVGLATDGSPDADELAAALDSPARPLFLGRKTCLPAGRILLGVVEGSSPLAALAAVPRVPGRGDTGPLPTTWWPDDLAGGAVHREVVVTDERDWPNQVHVGRRTMCEGTIDPPGGSDVRA